jgi:hypothetical protein
MDVGYNRFEQSLNSAIVKFRAETAADRARIYAAARASLKRSQSGKPGDAETLEAAIEKIESSFSKRRRTTTLGFLRTGNLSAMALVLGMLAGAAVVSYWPQPGTENADGPAQRLAQSYSKGLPLLPEANAFLQQVVDSIIKRQQEDRSAFVESAKTFISLAKFDPELASQMPKILPAGTAVIVRADAYNFKVLMNWTLCGVASISKPDMVDPVRGSGMTVGCPFFGLWSAGAAKW